MIGSDSYQHKVYFTRILNKFQLKFSRTIKNSSSQQISDDLKKNSMKNNKNYVKSTQLKSVQDDSINLKTVPHPLPSIPHPKTVHHAALNHFFPKVVFHLPLFSQ
jgi:hypothetical protein